jgi:uncharacterized protein (DUF3820 family)
MLIINDKLYVKGNNAETTRSKALVTTTLVNIQSLGFTLSVDLINEMMKIEESEFVSVYTELLQYLRKLVGYKKYKPMYPNFPNQVLEASDIELYFNAFIHYLTGMLPIYEKKERLPLIEPATLKVVELATEADIEKYFSNLLDSQVEYDVNMKEIIEKNINYVLSALEKVESIPNKENMIYISKIVGRENISHMFKTTTDVLRFAVALCDGDISLAKNTKFTKIGRPDRKFVLSLFERLGKTEEMVARREVYIKLAEVLHPGEYKRAFPKAFNMFDALRNTKVETFNGKFEKLIKSNIVHASAHIMTRPGVFARNLDRMIRSCKNENEMEYVLECFRSVADKVSTKVLFQVVNHFQDRSNPRLVFPKGNVAKVKVLPALKEFNEEKIQKYLGLDMKSKIQLICDEAIIRQYVSREPMGKVYVAPELNNYNIPFGLRSASKVLHTIGRGSKFTYSTNKILRFFIWWKNLDADCNSRVDIDLSVAFFGDNGESLGHTSWTNLKNGNYSVHSGDITDAPNGASEFIDIRLDTIIKTDIRYVVPSVFSYTGQKFVDMPECFFGWMERKSAQRGGIYEPTTVKEKIDLASASTSNTPVLIDLFEKTIYWMDLSTTESKVIEGAFENLCQLCMTFTKMSKPTVGRVLSLNAIARGELVSDPNEADIVFDSEFAYKTDEIIGNYL